MEWVRGRGKYVFGNIEAQVERQCTLHYTTLSVAVGERRKLRRLRMCGEGDSDESSGFAPIVRCPIVSVSNNAGLRRPVWPGLRYRL
jgi:hypothetical protein